MAADYDSSLPVRTETNGDVVAHIADPTTITQLWKIDGDGRGLVSVGNGDNTLAVNDDGSINANIVVSTAGDEIHVFDTEAAGVPGTPATVIDYTVTTAKTLMLKKAQGAASGKAKVEVKTGASGSETLKAVGFISTASGQVEFEFPQPIEVVAGDKVLVIVTNMDKANNDLYAYINGIEV